MRNTLLIIAGILFYTAVISQPKDKKSVVIGKMTTKENALLILNPPEGNQGVILPQLSTAQRTSLIPTSPSENGLTVFDTDLKSYFFWSDGAWVRTHAENNRKIKFLSIDPLNFQGLQTNNNIRHGNHAVFETDNTFITPSRDDDGTEIIAPINLPHGAVLQELTLYYMDNDSRNLKIKLMRKVLSGINEDILNWESSGNESVVKEQSFSSFNGNEIIDLEKYTYRLLVAFDIDNDDPSEARQRIYGVKVKYQE